MFVLRRGEIARDAVEVYLMRRLRWTRLLCLAAGIFGLGAWPVAARTMRAPQPPPPRAVRVQYGDSLWTIARKHADPNRDVRAVVAEMLRVNNVDPQALQPGQTLLIPADCLPEGRS